MHTLSRVRDTFKMKNNRLRDLDLTVNNDVYKIAIQSAASSNLPFTRNHPFFSRKIFTCTRLPVQACLEATNRARKSTTTITFVAYIFYYIPLSCLIVSSKHLVTAILDSFQRSVPSTMLDASVPSQRITTPLQLLTLPLSVDTRLV